MRTEFVTVEEFFDGDERLIDKWSKTPPGEWARVGGFHVTGAAKQADMGYTFGEAIAELSEEDLMGVIWHLRDDWQVTDGDPLGPIKDGLIEIAQAELGGRWVR